MSAKEKQVAQIFERMKWIIEQARQQCLLWEQHLSPKLILNGILPPPWLSNSNPKELDKYDIVSEVLLSQPQFGIPFSGRHCSLYCNLGAVSDDILCTSGLHNEVQALKKDCNIGDRISNLPDCSVNNDGCASSGPPELVSGAISPQNQIESRVSDSYHDPSLSLAKLQRSKPRQRALKERCSAKAPKRSSGGDNNADICAGTVAGAASSTLEEDHIEEPDLVKDFHPNIQICSKDDVERGDCPIQNNDKYNYSGRITRSKRLAQELNPPHVDSCFVVKEGCPPNISNEQFELANGLCFTDERCEAKEENKGEYQRKEVVGCSGYHESTTKSRCSSQSRYDSTSGRDKDVVCMQPLASVELTDLSKASDLNNGSRRNIMNDGDFCNNNEASARGGGCVNSINKSVQSCQPLISLDSQDRAVSVVGSFHSQKDPDSCALKANERLSRSDTCNDKNSQNVRLLELDDRSLSSSKKDSKLDAEVTVNSAENITASASRNTRAVTVCANEVSSRPVSTSDLIGRSLLVKPLHNETAVAVKVVDAQENVLSGANRVDDIRDRSTAAIAKVDTDLNGLVEEDPSCLGFELARVSPKVGMDVLSFRVPSDFVKSVKPKHLDFDDVGESNMNGIPSSNMKEGQQANLLEPNVHDEDTSLECQVKCNSSGKMCQLETVEAPIAEEGLQMEYRASQFRAADVVRSAINGMLLKESPVVPKEFCVVTSPLVNHSSPSQVAGEDSSGSLSKEVVESKFVSVSSELENDESGAKLGDIFSAAVTRNGLHKYTDKTVSDFTVGSPPSPLLNEVNVEAPNSISLCQNVDLLRQKWLSDGKITGFTTDFQIFKSSNDNFTHDVKHSWPQHKRRKIEVETGNFLPASSNLLEKTLDSTNKKSLSRDLSIEEDNPEVVREELHLTSDLDEDIARQYVVHNRPTEEMQGTQQCESMQGSSFKVRNKEKPIVDERDGSADKHLLEDEKLDPFHHLLNGGQECAQHLTCIKKSNSNRRVCPGGNAKFSDGSSVSPGIQCLNLIGADDTMPEIEGFIMPTDNPQPCTSVDQMDLDKMNLLSSSVDYTSVGNSKFMQSPLCYSSTPYKLRVIPNLYQSLPNGLLEGMNLRTSLPLNDGSQRSLSDCQQNHKVQYTPSVQTLWDRINSNLGSSGKRQSLKPELPCISEENENVDEVPEIFHKGIPSEVMTSSITREPLAEVIDSANPSASALQDDILTERGVDFVNSEFSFSGTYNKVKKKQDKQDDNRRRFTSKGKENISLGTKGAKRTSESVCNRTSRPKLSGKDSMKRQGPTNSRGKSSYNNIVSNIASFVPLVQQKQATAVVTGKRDIKVKALEAAEAAKRMAEKKENERKLKKEALKLERERLEQQNLRQLELQKKKKEEERKKKEAEMAAKKRQREDEEKKEKERKKRKRVNDVKKQQQEHEKIFTKKEEIQIQSRAAGEEAQKSKKFIDERENHQNMQLQDIREGVSEHISETEPLNMRNSTNDELKKCCPEYSEAGSDGPNNGKVKCNLIKATEADDLIIKDSLQEQSYDISPYKGSDDEDEDEDDIPNNKFIPSWASKHHLSLVVSSQKMDPEIIFPPQSFCNMAEVLLPRRLQL